MLKITSIQDKDEQRRLCAVCRAEYDCAAMAYAAYDDESGADELRGVVQFAFHNRAGHILTLSSPPEVADFPALFMLGRAAMNFTELCGLEDMYSELDADMSAKLGFARNGGGEFYVNLKGFFTAPCKHENDIKL